MMKDLEFLEHVIHLDFCGVRRNQMRDGIMS